MLMKLYVIRRLCNNVTILSCHRNLIFYLEYLQFLCTFECIAYGSFTLARFVSAKLSVPMTHDHRDCSLLLYLCTQHKIEMNLVFVAPPKVAKARNYLAIAVYVT
jgi:hypothetical protein